MLALLTDEQISYVVAEQVNAKRPEIAVESLRAWQGGAFEGVADEALLEAAALADRTLVTYDQKTIPPLLVQWGAARRRHGGVIFTDNATIAQSDIGGLVRALIAEWDRTKNWNWADRIGYLRPASSGE